MYYCISRGNLMQFHLNDTKIELITCYDIMHVDTWVPIFFLPRLFAWLRILDYFWPTLENHLVSKTSESRRVHYCLLVLPFLCSSHILCFTALLYYYPIFLIWIPKIWKAHIPHILILQVSFFVPVSDNEYKRGEMRVLASPMKLKE